MGKLEDVGRTFGKKPEFQALSQIIVGIVAVLGLISIAGELVQQAMGLFTSLAVLMLSVVGALALLNISTKGEFHYKNMNLYLGIILLISGVLLYNWIPLAFPGTFSLFVI